MVGSLDFDGVSTDLLNIFDFPLEDVEVGAEKDDWNDIQLLDLPSDISMGLSSVFCSGLQNDGSKEIKNISISYDRTCRHNRLPSAAETTSSGGVVLSDDSSSDIKHIHLFKTSSPVSILESNSSCFAENPRTADQKSSIIPVKRPRSKKRSRPSNFDRLYTLPFIAALERLRPSSASESDLGTPQVGKMFKTAKKAMKKKRATPHPIGIEVRNVSSQQSGEIKKCTHCQMTTTPQWREGPMGPKTLCNACGVRFRSGRLFPEYRPAASPTFVPSLHSNSHKKVIEMRNKTSQRVNSSSRAGVELYLRPQAGNSVRQLIV